MISDYILVRTLGEGSYGTVKLAKNQITHEKVAIKITSTTQAQREFEILSSLNHPHIIHVIQLLPVPIQMRTRIEYESAMVMEFVEGGDLVELLEEQGNLAEGTAVKFLEQILSALSYLHKLGIAHRDVKPDNILIDPKKGKAVLADFGLATHCLPNKLFTDKVGSLVYCAPEVLKENSYQGPETDIWSLGVVFYCMVTGCIPWEGSNTEQQLQNAEIGNWLKSVNMSRECSQLISAMLTVDPLLRPTADQLLQRLAATRHNPVIRSVSSSVMDLEYDSDLCLDGSDDDDEAEDVEEEEEESTEPLYKAGPLPPISFRTITEQEMKSSLLYHLVHHGEPEVLYKLLEWCLRSNNINFNTINNTQCYKYECTHGLLKFDIEICTIQNEGKLTKTIICKNREGDLCEMSSLLIRVFNKYPYL